jgi:hypothetical protein
MYTDLIHLSRKPLAAKGMRPLGHDRPEDRTPSSPYRTAEVAKRLGRQPSYTSAPRDSLIKKGLIYNPDYGQIDFTAPRFSRSCAVATRSR